MTTRLAGAGLAAVNLIFAGVVIRPLAAQGPGVSARVGVYRAIATYSGYQDPGVGAELTGHWGFRSGLALGLGGRVIGFQNGPRLAAFVDARYAPAPSPTRRIRPILGVRAGPYVDDLDGDPLIGVEAGTVLGLSYRVGTGISIALAGDLTVVVTTNDYKPYRRRRFVPGLTLGVTLH